MRCFSGRPSPDFSQFLSFFKVYYSNHINTNIFKLGRHINYDVLFFILWFYKQPSSFSLNVKTCTKASKQNTVAYVPS